MDGSIVWLVFQSLVVHMVTEDAQGEDNNSQEIAAAVGIAEYAS